VSSVGVLLDAEPAILHLPRLTTLLVYPPTDHFLGRYGLCWWVGAEGGQKDKVGNTVKYWSLMMSMVVACCMQFIRYVFRKVVGRFHLQTLK